MTGTLVGMGAFFFAYFWVLRHPLFPVTVMPLIGIDRLVTFRPEAIVLYVSLWIYVPLAPALLRNGRELASYGVAWVVLSVVGLGIFFLWPTAVPSHSIDWMPQPGFTFLKELDASGNACPSLHVAFAVLTAIWFEHLLRKMGAGRGVRAGNWLWCTAIVYSTLATRQHVALDVVAGAALGAIVAGLHLRSLRDTRAA